ncbi:hypothetical protein NDU88_008959 [Pleurodeles waltl]|uniref:Uncharacterized protein n=1 Tax=Pleurodeles waltl TaxID=8319 RepID=A0AAV7PVY2_PLEWA|nr:hypothetical protein NDU88_008959 [Pleurodeles waltl]
MEGEGAAFTARPPGPPEDVPAVLSAPLLPPSSERDVPTGPKPPAAAAHRSTAPEEVSWLLLSLVPELRVSPLPPTERKARRSLPPAAYTLAQGGAAPTGPTPVSRVLMVVQGRTAPELAISMELRPGFGQVWSIADVATLSHGDRTTCHRLLSAKKLVNGLPPSLMGAQRDPLLSDRSRAPHSAGGVWPGPCASSCELVGGVGRPSMEVRPSDPPDFLGPPWGFDFCPSGCVSPLAGWRL